MDKPRLLLALQDWQKGVADEGQPLKIHVNFPGQNRRIYWYHAGEIDLGLDTRIVDNGIERWMTFGDAGNQIRYQVGVSYINDFNFHPWMTGCDGLEPRTCAPHNDYLRPTFVKGGGQTGTDSPSAARNENRRTCRHHALPSSANRSTGLPSGSPSIA